MNSAHMHLLVNHIPVLGSVFALGILLPAIIRKDYSLIKAGLITIIISALFAIAATVTGEEAEHIIESINSIDNEALEIHEEYSKPAMWFSLANGLLSLILMISIRLTKQMNVKMLYINLVILCITVFLMARTAYSGGAIRHSEIHIQASE